MTNILLKNKQKQIKILNSKLKLKEVLKKGTSVSVVQTKTQPKGITSPINGPVGGYDH